MARGRWSELASLKSGYNSVVGLCVLFDDLMGCCWASFPTSKQWRWTGSILPCPQPCSALRTHPGLRERAGPLSYPTQECCDTPVPPRSSTAAWLCRKSPRSPTSPQCCPGSSYIGSSGRKKTPSTPCATSSSSKTQRMKVVGSGSGWGWTLTCVLASCPCPRARQLYPSPVSGLGT